MKLIFLRHAQSVFNKRKLIQGQYDCDLSINGLEKTKELKKSFDKKYDYCYCSPLKRTKLTAQIINDVVPITYDDRLKEVCFGVWEKTPIMKEKLLDYISGKVVPQGGESHEDIRIRVTSFLNDLKNNHKKEDTILIVTHGGIINAVQKILNLEDRKINNLEILEVEI